MSASENGDKIVDVDLDWLTAFLTTVVGAATREMLAAVVAERTQRAIDRARGRVD